ncbi:MAG: restriction endonuclease subunit S [Prevotella sp.]|nr:restriction endonuclease subunit S [Prevotella sp.]
MRLKDICKINSGKSIKACLIADKDVEHSTPCFGGNGLRGFVSSPNQVGGNPIIGRVGAQCGNVHYCKEPFYATEHALVVTIEDGNVNPLWLCRKLESMELGSYAEGAAQPVIAASKLLQLEITVPSLSEQQAIVSRLDSAFAKIDAVKANAENQLSDAKALFQKELSKAMTPKEGWEEKKVGEIFNTYAGGTPIKTHKEYYEGGDIPWIRSGEVCCKYITECEMFITEEGMNNSSAKYYPENTVLVAMYGATAAQVGILKFEATSNQAVCGILPHKDFVPEYVYYWFSNIQEELAAQAQGGAQPNISQIKIKNVVIPYAPLSEQQAIVTHLDTLSEKLKAVEEKQKAVMAECDAMKQALLREVF